MSLWNSGRHERGRRRTPGTVEADARAKRARDHLARKRRRERERLERERWRAEHAGSRAQLRGILAPLLFSLALVIGIAAAPPLADVFLFGPARLERVAVQGARALSPVTIATSTGVAAGRSLDSIDPRVVRENVAADPWIESVRALRLPTGTLVVSVVERRAVARWQRDASHTVELIDQHGQRFAGATAPGGPLPLVRGAIDDDRSLPPTAIEILDELGRHASLAGRPDALTLYLPEVGPKVAESGGGYVLQIGDEGPRALLGQRFFAQRIARLAALLSSQQAPVGDARWIDLRYADRAVLRTEPAPG